MHASCCLPALTRTTVGPQLFPVLIPSIPCWFLGISEKVLRRSEEQINLLVSLCCLLPMSHPEKHLTTITRWGCAECPRPSAALSPTVPHFITWAPLSLYKSQVSRSSFSTQPLPALSALYPSPSSKSYPCFLHTHTHTHTLLMSFMQFRHSKVKLLQSKNKSLFSFQLKLVGWEEEEKVLLCVIAVICSGSTMNIQPDILDIIERESQSEEVE